MTRIDHNKLKANPQDEDFSGKYRNSNIITKYLINRYFKSIEKLLRLTDNIESAHEIGIGEGWSTMRLVSMVDNLSASEYVETLLPIARANNPGVQIFQESVYSLKNRKESVDLVFLLEVLEHLDYPDAALKEINRITKKYLILGVPNEPLWRVLNFCRFKYWWALGNTPGHLNHWSKKAIINLVEANFGKVISVESPLPWIILLAEKYEK